MNIDPNQSLYQPSEFSSYEEVGYTQLDQLLNVKKWEEALRALKRACSQTL
jgi:hypothetical protein